ncbi:MAG: ParB/RepB/Spo0J family partition protein [Clostridiales Family XIII bacterium]|jgi:ParB family chromosome partitioning protein|nr:ParB/RepB/Spo0J family partition protein [Clostridiales Family XIII bacterium]
MAGKKKALGRGLDALFGEFQASVPVNADAETDADAEGGETQNSRAPTARENSENTILYVDIDDIRPNEMQPRRLFKAEAIEELAASIETYGVIQPVILRKAELGYELVAGERRWRAARKAGLRKIPALVRELAEEENALFAIIENMQREDLNTVEEANAFRTILDKYEMTQDALSRAVGKSRPYIANTLRVLKMPPEILEFLQSGALSLGHANALGAVKDRELQIRIAAMIEKKGLSVREAERLCAEAEARAGKADGGKRRQGKAKNAEIRAVEEELTSLVGTKVAINAGKRGGSVELRYFDKAGLDEIIELLRAAGAGRS